MTYDCCSLCLERLEKCYCAAQECACSGDNVCNVCGIHMCKVPSGCECEHMAEPVWGSGGTPALRSIRDVDPEKHIGEMLKAEDGIIVVAGHKHYEAIRHLWDDDDGPGAGLENIRVLVSDGMLTSYVILTTGFGPLFGHRAWTRLWREIAWRCENPGAVSK